VNALGAFLATLVTIGVIGALIGMLG